MATPINMPQVGQDLVTAIIQQWYVEVGQEIKKGDIVATVESDKASFEVEAFTDGVVLSLLFNEGDEAEVFKPIAYIGQKGEQVPGGPSAIENQGEVTVQKRHFEISPKTVSSGNGRIYVSPAARRFARENRIIPEQVHGTGTGGRVIRRDIQAALQSAYTETKILATPLARNIAKIEGVPLNEIDGSGIRGKVVRNDVERKIIESKFTSRKIKQFDESDEVIPFNRMRKVIADRLSFSKLSIPHFYLSREIDFTQCLQWREKTAEILGVKFSVNDIIIKTVAEALKAFPNLNAHVDDEKIVRKANINVGVAVSVDDGLLVPVIANANKKTIAEISQISARNADDARRGIVNPTIQGTFTVSNLGMLGVDHFQAIINPPESGILAVGAVKKKVVPAAEGFAIRDIAVFSLACDHRAVDGAYAARFLQNIQEQLNNLI